MNKCNKHQTENMNKDKTNNTQQNKNTKTTYIKRGVPQNKTKSKCEKKTSKQTKPIKHIKRKLDTKQTHLTKHNRSITKCQQYIVKQKQTQ